MTLRDRMARDARALVRADHTGESVTFHPLGSASRTFLAAVLRSNLEQLGGDRELGAAVREARVFMPRNRDATVGVLLVNDGDELTVALEEGGTPVRCRIVEKIAEDAGGFLVRVQR